MVQIWLDAILKRRFLRVAVIGGNGKYMGERGKWVRMQLWDLLGQSLYTWFESIWWILSLSKVIPVQVWNFTWPHSNNRWWLERKTSTVHVRDAGMYLLDPPEEVLISPVAHSCVHHQKLLVAGRNPLDQSHGSSVWACIQWLVYVGLQWPGLLALVGKTPKGVQFQLQNSL